MTHNDVLRRIRYIFDYSDSQMIAIFALADKEVTRAEISDWLKKEDAPNWKEIESPIFAIFLNGLINEKRGKREGAQPPPEKFLDNNLILKKIKIALNLKSEDVLEIMELADFEMGPHELSAFFRKPGDRRYRQCKDQVFRNFLQGMQFKYRDKPF